MSAASNDTGNLVDDLEESYALIMQVLSKEEENFNSLERDETRVDIDHSVTKFLESARLLEAFFVQKRGLLSTLKPELIVKEDVADLKAELSRKDELIKRHHEKIGIWQSLLADLQSWKSPQAGAALPGPNSNQPVTGPLPSSVAPPITSTVMNVLQQQQQPPPPSPQQQQQQQLQQIQQQQIQQMQQQIASSGPSSVNTMMSPQQAMFIQQQRVTSFGGQGPGGILPGPLAFLEKTTSNIGMTDGRR